MVERVVTTSGGRLSLRKDRDAKVGASEDKSWLLVAFPDLEYALRLLGMDTPGRLFMNIGVGAVVILTVYWALNIAWWWGIAVMCAWDALLLYWDSIPLRINWRRTRR